MIIEVSQKDYDGVYESRTGLELRSNVELYNKTFVSDISEISQIIFCVFTQDDSIQPDKEYLIIGKNDYFFTGSKDAKYVYIVGLVDSYLYQHNSRSGCIKGQVSEIKKYKLNYDWKDTDKKGNTFANFLADYGYKIHDVYLEIFAVKSLNKKLLENIFRIKGKNYESYSDIQFRDFKRELLNQITQTNPQAEILKSEIEPITDFKTLAQYFHTNRERIRSKEMLYAKNDEVQNNYPVNLAGRNISFSIYDGLKFNSALPFFYQYRNYKISTQILAEKYFSEIVGKENARMELYFGVDTEKATEILNADRRNYGLYFPLFMSFRQSVELAFKLIYVNEVLKKQSLKSDMELKQFNDRMGMGKHDLIRLLKNIEQYLEKDVFDYLWGLASFIYYNERTDASFSRYIIDNKLAFENVNKITAYYGDLQEYIEEFYVIMDDVISKMNLGFDPEKVFVN